MTHILTLTNKTVEKNDEQEDTSQNVAPPNENNELTSNLRKEVNRLQLEREYQELHVRELASINKKQEEKLAAGDAKIRELELELVRALPLHLSIAELKKKKSNGKSIEYQNLVGAYQLLCEEKNALEQQVVQLLLQQQHLQDHISGLSRTHESSHNHVCSSCCCFLYFFYFLFFFLPSFFKCTYFLLYPC